MNDVRSLYLHIPFCLSRCRYCDFTSHAGLSPHLREAYLDALRREITALPKGELDTLYLGGGTPSLLTPRELEGVLSAVTSRFSFAEDAELSLEMNPRTADREKLRAYRSLGINRISIGAQSLSDGELRALGRAHTAQDFLRAYADAVEAGFENLSCDLMYGLPTQTLPSLEATLDAVLALRPMHLSAYGLILEEGTPLWRERESLVLPDEEEEFAMYRRIVERLSDAGYRHYEISNYARDGAVCRHNMTYWRRNPYYAAGLSASSFVGGVRRTNTASLKDYLADPTNAVAEKTALSPEDAAFEEVMLSLRLSEGLDEAGFRRRHGYDLYERKREVLDRYLTAGVLHSEHGRLYLDDEGLYLSSALLTDLLD